jgi:small-conductance mechanosensitive channel
MYNYSNNHNSNQNGKKLRLLFAYLIFIVLIILGSGFLLRSQAQPDPGKAKTAVHGHIKSQPGKTNLSEKPSELKTSINKSEKAIKKIYHPVYSNLNKKISHFLGNWINQAIFYKVTWFTLFFSLFLLVLVFLFERLLYVINRSFLPKLPHSPTALNWLEILAKSGIKPFSLIIWIFGGYGALYQILDQFPTANDIVLRVAGVAGIITIIWFFSRFIGLLDQRLQDLAASTGGTVDSLLASLVRGWRRPLRLLFAIALIRPAFPLMAGPPRLFLILDYGWALAAIACVAWLILRATDMPVELITSHYNIEVKDNLEARKIHTQIRFFGRLVKITVVVVALAFMLMMFPAVRHVGISILASAGVMGIIAGLAAQRSIANILVGVQIAVTQPFRVDDVVVVEGEWGWIEEITATYVVVRIWDLRRLVLPIIYFTEKPFQNWTRTSADLLGTVFLYVDYTVPVEFIRQELYRILQNSSFWDGKAWGLQVTDATDRTIQLRALMSAADSPTAWNLRCEVREKLIAYLQENYPSSLPRIRGELMQPEQN